MSFIKKNILSKTMAVVDIGSYKVRVSICVFKNNKLKLIGYGEKRQDSSCFINGECEDIELLTENINVAIKKAEKSAEKKIKKIIISFPFSNLFLSNKKINYKRKNKLEIIDKKELQNILEKTGNIILNRTGKNITKISGLQKEDLKLIIGSITTIDLDNKKKKNILGNIGENITISFLNIFIPLNKYNLINYIGNIINKKIIKIIPSEYSIVKIFPQKDLVIINIGAALTYITIKKDNEVIGISKIGLGINDLINIISKNIKDTKINIINNLNNNIYLKEKSEFIDIWGESLTIGIKEIIKNKICPSNFVILGGGKNNFIENYFKKENHISKNIKLIKNIELIEFKNENLKKYIDNYDIIIKKISLDSLSLILEVNNLLNKEKNMISELLKKVIVKLGF